MYLHGTLKVAGAGALLCNDRRGTCPFGAVWRKRRDVTAGAQWQQQPKKEDEIWGSASTGAEATLGLILTCQPCPVDGRHNHQEPVASDNI